VIRSINSDISGREKMKKIILVFLLFPAMLFSISVSETINNLVEELAAEYTTLKSEEPFYSKQTVSIIEINNASKDAADNYVGEAIEALLKNAITDSLVFKFIDRQALDTAMEQIKLSLSGITDENDSIELGNIRGLRLLIDGSVTSENESFIISLRLIEVETTEIITTVKANILKVDMIELGNRIAYEFVTANGIGTSIFFTPGRYLLVPQSEAVAVGDDIVHAMAAGARLTYRLGQKWKISLNMDVKVHDVFYDNRTIGIMQNLTALGSGPGDVFEGGNDIDVFGFWEKDGSFTADGSAEATLNGMTNHYTLGQLTTTAGFVFSYVHSFSQKMNISAGLGPHINFMQLRQVYDNVPILINQGIAFKRYEVVMNFIGLGATAAVDFEYFILPRFALNVGCTYLFSVMLPPSEVDARSPTTGEYYYSTDNFAIESFGLNPFMMPDGRTISEDLYSPNHFKVYLGFSTYF
jgi:TolB-like protein